MVRSIVRRSLYAILTLWIISVISFWLSKQIPGDEVEDYLTIDERGYSTTLNPIDHRAAYARVAHKRKLDLPLFYFSFSSRISSHTDSILPFADRAAIRSWIAHSNNVEGATHLRNLLLEGLDRQCRPGRHRELCSFYDRALRTKDLHQISSEAGMLRESAILNDTNGLASALDIIVAQTEKLHDPLAGNVSAFLPSFQWHGLQNQYHQWMRGLLLRQPLTSLVDGRNAWTKINEAFRWTIVLNGIALLLSLLIGILTGIWAGKMHGTKSERIVEWILFALFAIPSFWLGTLVIYLFSSGEWLRIFPAGGLGSYQYASGLTRWSIISYHLTLPVLCLTLGGLAYVSRQMKQSVLHEYSQPYVQALISQGISGRTILRKHVIRNALFPLITIVGGSVPVLLSGSLVIEVIFGIPGMGRLMFNSLMSKDWPVAFPILMLGAAVTVFSYILTDLLYKWADPRIKTLES